MVYQVHEATEVQGQNLSFELSFQRSQKTSFISYFPQKPQNEDSKGLLFAIQTLVTQDFLIAILILFRGVDSGTSNAKGTGKGIAFITKPNLVIAATFSS